MRRGAEAGTRSDEACVGALTAARPQGVRPLPRAVWAALVFAPLLGWLSTLCMLASALWVLRSGGIGTPARRALDEPVRWLTLVALAWWLTLLAGDLLAAPAPDRVGWWADLRLLLVILPACVLVPMFGNAGITYAQIGRWASLSVWTTAGVIALEYGFVVQWAGLVHHRPRALAGNALFVSTMLVPMMMLAWLDVTGPGRHAWIRPWATHATGIVCLGALLGARASTLMALALLPLALWWLGHGRGGWQRAGMALLACAATAGLLALLGPHLSVWYGQRWAAIAGLMTGAVTGAEWPHVTDYGIATRALHWPAAWQAFLERPWLGHGFRNEAAVLAQHLPAGTPVLPTAHQQYLSFLLWSGIPGLVAGCLLVALPLLLAWKEHRGRCGMYAAAALSVPLMLHGLTDTVLDDLRIVSYHLMMTVMLHAAVEPAPRT